MHLFDYARRLEVLLHSHSNKVQQRPSIDGRLYLKTRQTFHGFTCRVDRISAVPVLFKLTIYCFLNRMKKLWANQLLVGAKRL